MVCLFVWKVGRRKEWREEREREREVSKEMNRLVP